jgi:hypothetical protein
LAQAVKPCSFDEFKLYYESTEKVTDRRLATNRWNYSTSVAVMLGIISAYACATGHRDYFLLVVLMISLISAVAALFCVFWLRQVQDWKALNNAKFKVLAQMADGLRFEMGQGARRAASYHPFDREWKIIQEQDGLVKVRLRPGQIEALNASGAELFLPRVLGAIFALILVSSIGALAESWTSLPHAVLPAGVASRTSSPLNSSTRREVNRRAGDVTQE